jgi:hypothetical protein
MITGYTAPGVSAVRRFPAIMAGGAEAAGGARQLDVLTGGEVKFP